VCSVSSNVIFPELPDASIDTLNPIVFSPTSPYEFASKQISKMMADHCRAVNGHSGEGIVGHFEKAKNA
jgi:hypothetical protein